MTRLQLRIAGILIGAICMVVAVSTFVAFVAISYPAPERMAGPVASQIRALHSFVSADPQVFSHLDPAAIAALGPIRPDLTAAVAERLRADGLALPVTVYDDPATGVPIAVTKIGGETLSVDFPSDLRPPLDLWIILGAWMGLVIIGVIVVSLIMAYRVTSPFTLLERAVGTVGSDGVLPHIPETGSRETVETAAILNRLSDRLRSAMESRMRLVAAAGHDFRTPMTRMRLRAEFLDDEERIAWLRDIDELDRIADSAIGLVREEVSTAATEPVALDQLLRGEVEDLAAQGYRLTLGQVDPVTLPLPPLATRRALRNLLINAATHGRGGQAELRVAPGMVNIVIRDEGPGIPDDLLERVFEPFFRAEAGRMQTTPGAGLGLALAAEIVERLGGTLRLRNCEGGGLEQDIAIPLRAAAAATAR